MTWKLVAATLCVALVASSAVCADGALPIEVRDSIKKNALGCDNVPIDAAFLTKPDVNGDGINDYILDYAFHRCVDVRSRHCGTDGCLRTVFVSVPGNKLLKVIDERVRGLAFRHLSGRPAMLIKRDLSACGKPGYRACSETLYWNGNRFAPDH